MLFSVRLSDMASLFPRLQAALGGDRVAVSAHAAVRMRQRRVLLWQVIAGTLDGAALRERPEAEPNPTIEVEIVLPDGARAKAVWAFLAESDFANLVTIHFFDR